MADFSTRLSDPDLSFKKVQARVGPNIKADQAQKAVQAVTAVGKVAGKAVARSNAADVTGADLSLEQANINAENIDIKITEALSAEKNVVGGPLDRTRVAEIKDKQLSQFANDDRTLLALRDQGTLSTLEVRARRQLNLQRALSNPINALFKADFLNATSDLTGGSAGAAKSLFPFTPEEEQALAIRAAETKARADFAGTVAGLVESTDQSQETVEREIREEALDNQKIKDFERKSKLNTPEEAKKASLIRNGATRSFMKNVSALAKGTGGFLDGNGMATAGRSLDDSYRAQIQNINAIKDIAPASRTAMMADLDKWKVGMDNTLKMFSAADKNTEMLALMKQRAEISGWKNMPMYMTLLSIDKTVGELLIKSGGNVDRLLDRFTDSKGASENIRTEAKALSSLIDFTKGAPVTDPAAVPPLFASIEGAKVVSEKANGEMKEQFKKLYHEAPENSLRLFNEPSFRMSTPKDEGLQTQVVEAMGIVRDKMSLVRSSLAPEALIEVSTIRAGGQMRGRTKPIMDVPDSMESYVPELKQMFRTIKGHPWSWKHVEEDYVDEVDAFNGYMRGEFELSNSVDTAAATKRNRRGRPAKVAAPVEETSTIDNSNLVDADKEKELKLLIQQEEEGTLDDAGFNAMEQALSDKLDRIREGSQQIRDRAQAPKDGSRPLSPIPKIPDVQPVDARLAAEPLFPTTGEGFDIEALKTLVGEGNNQQSVIVEGILGFEAGFQDNPDDKGNFDSQGNLIGTNKGITPSSYKAAFGKEPTVDELKNLTTEQAIEIYNENYWKPNRIGEMPPEVQEIAMNMFVMTSPKNAAKAIQRAAGAKEDGIIGPQTLKAMRGLTSEEIWKEYEAYLRSLKAWGKFGKGWTNRYNAILGRQR